MLGNKAVLEGDLTLWKVNIAFAIINQDYCRHRFAWLVSSWLERFHRTTNCWLGGCWLVEQPLNLGAFLREEMWRDPFAVHM